MQRAGCTETCVKMWSNRDTFIINYREQKRMPIRESIVELTGHFEIVQWLPQTNFSARQCTGKCKLAFSAILHFLCKGELKFKWETCIIRERKSRGIYSISEEISPTAINIEAFTSFDYISAGIRSCADHSLK